MLEARDYLAADAIVRGFVRLFSPARIVADESYWIVWALDANDQEVRVVSGRDLNELAHNIEKLLAGKREGT